MNDRTSRALMILVLVILFILSLAWFGVANRRTGMPLEMVFITSLLLGIPLTLLYFSIGLMVEAWQQHRRPGGLSQRMVKFLYRTPRIAGIVLALFIGLFALDAFDTPGSVWIKIGAFLIHASPTIFMISLLVLAWRREWVGALAFGLAALFFIRTVFGGGGFGLGNLLIIVLPLAMVAVMFWLNWLWRSEIRQSRGSISS